MCSRYLPYPFTAEEIRRHLLPIKVKLLGASEKFIQQQVRKPFNDLFKGTKEKFALDVGV